MAVPPTPQPAPQPAPQQAPRPAPKPASPRNELGAKLEQLMRENRPRALRGKGRVITALLLLAGGGMLVQSFLGGSTSPIGKAVSDRERASKAAEPPAGPETGTSTTPEPAPPPPSDPTPTPGAEATVAIGTASDLAAAVSRAPAKQRAALRVLALTTYGEMLRGAAHRRTALEAAARLAGDGVPEESELWARITQGAFEALSAPADAGAAVLYLTALFDRGGPLGVAALERVVEDEKRPLELRVAAARALPPAARAAQASRIGSRANPHPALLSALR